MGNKDKNKDQGDSATATEGVSGDSITSPRDARHANRDLSWKREARNTVLAKQVAEAIAREMAKDHAHCQALLNERGTTAMPTSLRMTSGALGFKIMDPFDWTKEKAIYQRWQMWSEKARHALDAMEGDSKRLKFLISTTGLMEKEWAKLNLRKTKRSSSARQNMIDWRKMKKKASTLQKRQKVTSYCLNLCYPPSQIHYLL